MLWNGSLSFVTRRSPGRMFLHSHKNTSGVAFFPWNKHRMTGHLFFLVMIVLAVVFHRERMLYADSAWYVFKIVNFSKLNVEAGRSSAIITQLLPLIFVRQELPLKFVILAYSVSFFLVYYLVYIICVYAFRNEAAGLVILLVLVLGIRHNFYHPVQETLQGLVYTVLLFAWLRFPLKLKIKEFRIAIHFIIGLLIIILCYFAHPMTLFPVLFILGYHIVEKNDWNNYSAYALIILTLVVYSLKYMTTDDQSYEGQFFGSFGNALETMGNFFNLYSLKFFLKRLGGLYFFTLIIAISVSLSYIHQKAWLKFGYFLITSSGFFIITVLTYHMGDSDMAMERVFMPLSIFIGIPFVQEWLTRYRKQDLIAYSFLVLVLIFSMLGISRTGSVYSDRLAYLDELLENSSSFPGNKFIIEKKSIDMSKIIVPWAIGVETLLYSSLDSPDDARTIYLVDDLEEFQIDWEDPALFLGANFLRDWNASSLNKTYIKLQDGKYSQLVLP
jgi:hypothetical protein